MRGPFQLPVVQVKQITIVSLQHCVPAWMHLRKVLTLFGLIIAAGGPPFAPV
jgi:hypothetical protein